MDYTYATIIIAAADQKIAQDSLNDSSLFIAAASPTGQEPATNYFTSGPWSNAQMDYIADEVAWKKKILSPDWQQALAGEGLQMIVQPEQAQ